MHILLLEAECFVAFFLISTVTITAITMMMIIETSSIAPTDAPTKRDIAADCSSGSGGKVAGLDGDGVLDANNDWVLEEGNGVLGAKGEVKEGNGVLEAKGEVKEGNGVLEAKGEVKEGNGVLEAKGEVKEGNGVVETNGVLKVNGEVIDGKCVLEANNGEVKEGNGVLETNGRSAHVTFSTVCIIAACEHVDLL